MQELIGTVQTHIKPLEKLDLLNAIKRVLTETTPWEDIPKELVYQMGRGGIVSQPLISDWGPYRVGFFKREFTPQISHNENSPSLLVAISRRGTNEGVAIRLYPTRINYIRTAQDFPCVTVFYRSLKNNGGIFNVNLVWLEIECHSETSHTYEACLPELVNANRICKPNFELTGGYIDKSYTSSLRSENSYWPEKLIRIEKLKPIEIPWVVDFSQQGEIYLRYSHPVPTIWYSAPRQFVVELKLSRDESSNDPPNHQSQLIVTWPKFGKQLLKFLARLNLAYKNCYFESIDLVAEIDGKIPHRITKSPIGWEQKN